MEEIMATKVVSTGTATNVRLPDDLRKQAKRYALDNDTTFREVVEQAIKEFLDRREAKTGK